MRAPHHKRTCGREKTVAYYLLLDETARTAFFWSPVFVLYLPYPILCRHYRTWAAARLRWTRGAYTLR